MPRKRKIVSHSVASLPTVPEIGVEVEIGSSCTPDLNSNPGPCRPRRKASTPHPGLGRFLYAHLFLFLFLFWGIFIDRRKKNWYLLLAFEHAAESVYKADDDDFVERGRKYERQKTLEEARATSKKLSTGNSRIYLWIFC